MMIVVQKVLQNHKEGKAMRQVEFTNINGSKKCDKLSREIFQANPNAVLAILQTEEQASRGLKEDFFIRELRAIHSELQSQIGRLHLSN